MPGTEWTWRRPGANFGGICTKFKSNEKYVRFIDKDNKRTEIKIINVHIELHALSDVRAKSVSFCDTDAKSPLALSDLVTMYHMINLRTESIQETAWHDVLRAGAPLFCRVGIKPWLVWPRRVRFIRLTRCQEPKDPKDAAKD